MIKLCYINQKEVDRSICSQLPPKSADTQLAYVILHSDQVCVNDSANASSQAFWILMILHRHDILAFNNYSMYFLTIGYHAMTVGMSLRRASTGRRSFLTYRIDNEMVP